MKIVVTSDWHLDASTAGYPRFDDVAAGATEVVNRAIAIQAGAFVFLGDLTDPDSLRAHRAVAFAVAMARRLSDAGVQSVWVAGNHDVVEDGHGTTTLSPLCVAGLPRVTVCERPSVGLLAECVVSGPTVRLVVLPYAARAAAYDPAVWVMAQPDVSAGDALPTLVLGHLVIGGATPGTETTDMSRGRDVSYPVAQARQRWPGAMLLNGHYHARQTVNGVIVPGSLERLTFGEEANEPGWLELEIGESDGKRRRGRGAVRSSETAGA